jgi:predicted pyridoxine 5'-phosphate oxidase superfamily flavin-nucleotide-binding protein
MKKIENLNRIILKKVIEEKVVREATVIPDECGDSLWEAVLQQEKPAGDETKLPELNASPFHGIHNSRETASTEAFEVSIPDKFSIMARNFASLAFTNAAKAIQAKYGSRSGYARIEKETYVDGFTKNEIDFITQRDSLYIASIGDHNFPYLQHRGGPRGFVKVLDAKRFGFIDFRGNMQYISAGNISTNSNVALIMVDYPNRERLKILAKAEIIGLNDDPALTASLSVENYKIKPERILLFHVEAYDWNCPQHITPRYTIEDIQQVFHEQERHIANLEMQIKELKQKIYER